MKSHKIEETDLIKMNLEHLRSLKNCLPPFTDEHKLRVASASLRFLLIDGNLARAWKVIGLGGPIIVEAMCFAAQPSHESVGFCGGGNVLAGVPFSIGWGDVALIKKRLDLLGFLNSGCIWFKGVMISRRDLIKFVANTKGGNHYDPNGKSPRSQTEKFDLLRKLETEGFSGVTIAVNDRDLIHHEVASIIQALLESHEIEKFFKYPHST